MRLDEKSLGLAAAASFAVLWVICSGLVALSPGYMMGLTGHMMHADFGGMQWTLNITGFIYGLLLWCILAGAAGWLIAYFYNRFNAGE